MKKICIVWALLLALLLSGCGEKSAPVPVPAPEGDYSISLAQESVDLLAGQEDAYIEIAEFTRNGEFADPAYLRYTTSDADVVTVENGNLKGVGAGTASVVVSCGNASDELTVRVWERAESADLSESTVRTYGRTYGQNGGIAADNVNSGIGFSFYGTQCRIQIYNSAGTTQYLRYYLDGDREGRRVPISRAGLHTYSFAADLEPGIHSIRVMKATEQNLWGTSFSLLFTGVETGEGCELLYRLPEEERLKIDFYGDSITAGQGNLAESSAEGISVANSDGTQTYAAFTAEALGSESDFIGYGGITVKAPKYYGTDITMYSIWHWYSTLNRTEYPVDPDTDFVVINLGTNDAGVAGYGTQQFAQDYLSLLNDMSAAYPRAKFVLCYGMMGTTYFIELGIRQTIEEFSGEAYYCRLPSNLLGAGSHPTVEGHRAAAKTLTEFLKTL